MEEGSLMGGFIVVGATFIVAPEELGLEGGLYPLTLIALALTITMSPNT